VRRRSAADLTNCDVIERRWYDILPRDCEGLLLLLAGTGGFRETALEDPVAGSLLTETG